MTGSEKMSSDLNSGKSDVTGCMYQWISQYLTNRKARVHLNLTYSRKKTPKKESLREAS